MSTDCPHCGHALDVWLTFDEAIAYSKKGSRAVGEALRTGKLRGFQTTRGANWSIQRADVDVWLRGEDPPSLRIPAVTRRKSA